MNVKNLIKENVVPFSAMVAAVVGFLMVLIFAFALCGTTQVGVNLLAVQNPAVIIGAVLVVAGVIASIEEIIRAKVTKNDATAGILSLEVTITFLMVTVLFLVLFSAWDLIINM